MFDVLAGLNSKPKGPGRDVRSWAIRCSCRCIHSSDHGWSDIIKRLGAISCLVLEDYGAMDAMVKRLIWVFVDD